MAVREIKTKLVIEGEGEYKASLQRINTELKTLQSSLKLAESQYQGQANSLQALSAKNEALTKVVEAQKNKVEELKRALENAQNAEKAYADKKDELAKKIEENNKALEKLKSTAGDTAKEEERLTKENEELNKQMQLCDEGIAKAEKSAQNWQLQLNNASVKLNDLDRELKDNEKYLQEAKDSTDGTAKSIDEFGKKTEESADSASDLKDALVAAGLVAALEKTAEALRACVDAAADFEHGMSAVEAIAGATGDEMIALTEKAKAIGAGTMYTASQAADALGYMALAGWNAEEMLSGVDGVISLAAASGEDLARTSDIVTDALTAFGLSASDANDFVDKLAATAANSNTTVNMLGDAFKYAAPVAGALGYSIEDVAVAMGLMANNGIKGSTAGTTMRNVFSTLAGEVKLSAKAFGDVVVSTQDTEGNMLGLADVIQKLRGYFDQMTQAEQVSNAQALVGQRAYAGLLAILNTTTADYDKLSAAIKDSTGAAQKMADIRMDNLTGQVTLMSSAWDAVKIAVGDQLLPVMTGLTSAATDTLSWLAGLIEENEELVPLLTTIVSAVGMLTVGMVGYVAVTKLATPIAAAFNAVMNANPIVLAATAILALAAGVAVLASNMSSAVPSVKELSSAAENVSAAFETADQAYADSAANINATAEVAGVYVQRLKELEAQGLESAEAQDEYRMIVDKLNTIMPELNVTIDEQTGLLEGGVSALEAQIDGWKQLALQEALTTRYKDQIKAWAEAELELYENQEKLKQAEIDRVEIETRLSQNQQKITELLEERKRIENDNTLTVKEANEALKANSDELNSVYQSNADLAQQLRDNDALQQNLNDAIATGTTVVAENEAAVTRAQKAVDELGNSSEDTAEGMTALDESMASAAKTADQIQTEIQDLALEYQKAYEAAESSINGQVGLFDDFASEISDDTDTVEEMLGLWSEQTDNLAKYTENLRKAAIYGLDEGLIQSLSDGSPAAAGHLATIIEHIEELGGSTEGLSESATSFVDEFNAAFMGTAVAREDFKNTVAGIQTDFEETVRILEEEAKNADFSGFNEAIEKAFGGIVTDFEQIGTDAGSGLASGISAEEGNVGSAAGDVAQAAVDSARDVLDSHSDSRVTIEIGHDFDGGLITGIKDRQSEVEETVNEMLDKVAEDGRSKSEKAVRGMVEEFAKLSDKVGDKLSELRTRVDEELTPLVSSFEQTGVDMVDGMIDGINQRSSDLYRAIENVVGKAINTAKETAATASPSKKTRRIFQDVGEGMIVGLEDKRRKVAEKMQRVVDEAMKIDVAGKVDLIPIIDRLPNLREDRNDNRVLMSDIKDAIAQAVNAMGTFVGNQATGDLTIITQTNGREFYRATLQDFRLVQAQNPIIVNDF